MSRYLLLILLPLYLTACKKADTPYNPAAGNRYILINRQAYPLVADLYNNRSDRLNQTNLIYSCPVPAQDTGGIPLSKLNDTTMYQYDLYSSDYMYANWPSGINGTSLNAHGNSNTFDLGNYTLTSARYYFLRGNNEKTTWKAVYRSYGGGSDWSTLTDSAKFMLLEIYRNETATINYFPQQFFPTFYLHDTATYISATQQEYYTTLMLSGTKTASYTFIYSTATKPAYGIGGHSSIDTLILSYTGYDWVMVRQ